MTDEEIREIRTKALKDDLVSINNRLCHAFNQGFELGRKSIISKEKTGWHIAHGMYEDRFWCSCGYIKVMDTNMIEWKYCPICGGTREVSE